MGIAVEKASSAVEARVAPEAPEPKAAVPADRPRGRVAVSVEDRAKAPVFMAAVPADRIVKPS